MTCSSSHIIDKAGMFPTCKTHKINFELKSIFPHTKCFSNYNSKLRIPKKRKKCKNEPYYCFKVGRGNFVNIADGCHGNREISQNAQG